VQRERPSLACRAFCRLFFRHVVKIIKYIIERLALVIRENMGTSASDGLRDAGSSRMRWVGHAHALLIRSRNQPLQNGVEIGFLFCADAIAAHLSVRHCFEVQAFNQLVNGQLVGQIGLVAKDEQRDAF